MQSGDKSWEGDGGRLSGQRQAGPCVSESGQSSRNKLGRKGRWCGRMRRREGIGLEIEAEEGTLQSPESLAETGKWEVGWWGRVCFASLGGNLGLIPPKEI